MSSAAPRDPSYSFEEYKMYYESTEKVTDRRISMNSLNYSLCAATIAAIAILTSWTWTREEFRLVAMIGDLALAIMGALFCSLWIGQIRDFKYLNNAKFQVLNNMAAHIGFGETDDHRVSAEPFAKEWDILKNHDGTSDMGIIVLKASNMEYLVPKAFRWAFLLIIAAGLWTIYQNWSLISQSVLLFPPHATPKP
jgi:hypothetical protein